MWPNRKEAKPAFVLQFTTPGPAFPLKRSPSLGDPAKSEAMPDLLNGKSATGKPRLLDEVRSVLRFKHYSLRTEEAYTDWIKRFIRHHGLRHPRDMGAEEVRAFLSFLATDRDVAASTQNQALSALLFLYKEVLGVELPWLGEVERSKRPKRLPVVLTREEARRVVDAVPPPYRLMAELLYDDRPHVLNKPGLAVRSPID